MPGNGFVAFAGFSPGGGSGVALRLVGGSGNDTLNGGSGAINRLEGGDGNDTYYVRAGDTVFDSDGTQDKAYVYAMQMHGAQLRVALRERDEAAADGPGGARPQSRPQAGL